MNLTIHRGTHEIGGTCIEMVADGYRLLLDMGLPLNPPPDTPIKKLLPNIPDLYTSNPVNKTSLLISHAHQDHWGLAGYVNKQVQIYASKGTKALLDINQIFIRKGPMPKVVNETIPKQPFEIGPFRITGYIIDHSAPDAMAFLVQLPDKKISIFYTGDFRIHGRKSYTIQNVLSDLRTKGKIDLLFIEGTTVSRSVSVFPTEKQLVTKFIREFHTLKNTAFIFLSGQNLDRWVTIFNAAVKTGKVLIIDLYTARVLRALKIISESIPIPGWTDDNGNLRVRVFYWNNHCKALETTGEGSFIYENTPFRIKLGEILKNPSKFVFLARSNSLIRHLIEKYPHKGGIRFIWSMWSGYLDAKLENSAFSKSIRELSEKYKIPIEEIHTSGHAGLEDIKWFIGQINPKVVIPIHTDTPEIFLKFGAPVKLFKDNVKYTVSTIL